MDKQLLNLVINKDRKSVLDRIKECSYPLILWGGGNVALAAYEYLVGCGIHISAVFVDDQFYSKGKFIKDKEILRFEDILRRYDKFSIIVGHSAYEKAETIVCDKIQDIFYLTSVIYRQTKRISYDFFVEKESDYETTYDMLEDEKSKRCMAAYLNARINDDVSYVLECFERTMNYFNNDVLVLKDNEVFVDVGAYTGDTIAQFLCECGGKYGHIYAFEVNTCNFNKLNNYCDKEQIEKISLFKTGLSNVGGKKEFVIYGEETNAVSPEYQGEEVSVEVVETLDDLYDKGTFNHAITFLKINFFVGTLEVLEGAKKLLSMFKPKLAVTVGFDATSVIYIPQFIKKIVPEYKIYFRYNEAMPARLVMYAFCEEVIYE